VIAAPPHSPFIPAQAGIQNLFKHLGRSFWVPAFAETNGSGCDHRRYIVVGAAQPPSRQRPGVTPVTRLNARLKAASDS
jgi:hypothetical protein